MRGAKTLSGLAVEVFIEEERIPPDPVLLEAELASSSAIATLVVPLDVVVSTASPSLRSTIGVRTWLPAQSRSVDDGVLTYHWRHARFDLKSGCTFDLWADDASICPVELCND
jgi:hypothetical protein